MILVDTSAWIEWLVGSPAGEEIGRMLPEPAEWIVPTIVQLELASWLARELDDERADRVLAFLETCVIVGLDSRLALSAAAQRRALELATADAIIYATALSRDASLLTCDAHFKDLPGVVLLPKSPIS